MKKWIIKARVTEKTDLRKFNRNGGEGKVFKAVLLDASGSDIQASFFNDAADKFVNMLEKGQCFTFSQGSIKVANRQYNNTSHRYELTFDKETLIEKSEDDKDRDCEIFHRGLAYSSDQVCALYCGCLWDRYQFSAADDREDKAGGDVDKA